MTNDNDRAGSFHGEPSRSEFPQLVARHHQLVRGLRQTEDVALRSELSQELRRVRQQIAEITGQTQPTQSGPVDSSQEHPEQGPYEHEIANDELTGQLLGYGDPEQDPYVQDPYVQAPDPLGEQPPVQPDSLTPADHAYAVNAYADYPYPSDAHADESQTHEQYFEEPVEQYVEEPVEQYVWHDSPEALADVDDSASYRSSAALPPAPAEATNPDAIDHHQPIELRPQPEADSATTTFADYYRSIKPSGMVLAVVGVCLVALASLLWFGDGDRTGDTAAEQPPPASPTAEADTAASQADAVVANVRAILAGLGLSSVVVDHREDIIHLGGPVPSQADFDAAVTAAQAVAAGFPLETSGLVIVAPSEPEDPQPAVPDSAGRPAALQAELDRILAGTPLIFGSGEAALTDLHQRILNNVVLALSAYPGFSLNIVGYTDELGDDTSNRDLSLGRAEGVRQYLVAEGLPAEAFSVEAKGEAAASGAALAGLERRVELEVNGTTEPAAEQATAVRVAIVAPSASNDLAFTQSMVDAVNLLATETPIELSVTDNTFVPDEAAAAVRQYADQGYDLIIAHGSQFGASLIEIAPQYPETAFAWGTASDTFGLPNVYAYDAAAQEGGYLLGAIAAMVSTSDVIGVVGPIEVGDAALFVNGFAAGAKAQEPVTDVRVTYTGSFSDTGLAAEAAEGHLSAGADVLTGSAQMVVGAVAAAQQSNALWFGTQANQTSLAPGSVVASQVYRWEIALRPIIQDIKAATMAGDTYTANLANGGLVIEYNPDIPLAPEIRQRADQVLAEIVNGIVVPPG